MSSPMSSLSRRTIWNLCPWPKWRRNSARRRRALRRPRRQKRLTQYGPNEIEEKKINPLLKFLTYFWGPIPWMIEAAVLLSAFARHWPDFFIILVLLLANAVVGFWEEHQAGNAIAALKARLAIKARVQRDGKWVTPAGARAGAGRRDPRAAGRHRAGGRASAGRGPDRGRPVGADRRIAAGFAQAAARRSIPGSIVRQGESDALVYATGAEHLFRQDRVSW